MKEPSLITKHLAELGKGIINLEPEVSDPTGRFLAFDDGGVEADVGEFLYGLVRVLKPENVLTTGVYSGISDMYIAQALKDNGHGASIACEYEEHHINRAKELWQRVGVSDKITVFHGSSLDYKPDREFDFVFLDTEPHIRFMELEKFYPFVKPGGFIGIHDLPRGMCQGNANPDHPTISSWPFGDIPSNMLSWLQSGELVKFHFPTPRGLVFFYKQHPEDYKL